MNCGFGDQTGCVAWDSALYGLRPTGFLLEGEANGQLLFRCRRMDGSYRVNFVRSGHFDAVHRVSSLNAGPGTVAAYQLLGNSAPRQIAALGAIWPQECAHRRVGP
jgi:hypothetical protein